MQDRAFTWGVTRARHEVGPYGLIEYHPYKPGTFNDVDETQILFHGYLDGESVGEAWASMDEALAGLIVRRHLGSNFRHLGSHFVGGLLALKLDEEVQNV